MKVVTGVLREYAGEKGPFSWVRPTDLGRFDPQMTEITDWCLDSFGIDSRDNWFYSFEQHAFHFRKRDDLVLFLLRWS